MTEPLDVSLRVKLAYEAAGGAKAAVADIEAIRAGAQRLGSQQGILQSARQLADLGKGAAVAKASLDDLAQAGSRLSAASGGSARLAAAVAGIARPASEAQRELKAVASAASGLSRAAGSISGDGISALSTEAVAARRAIADMTAAAGRLAGTAGPTAVTAEMGKAARAAGDLERQIDALLTSGDKLTAWRPAQVEAAMKSMEAQAKAGRGEIGAMAAAADKLGAAGPARLAGGIAAVTPAATEARRHVDDVGSAARAAERDMERMSSTASAAGGGGHGGEAVAAAGGGHGGPGGLRGAAIAAARPLHMERLVMSAFTPIGAAGLAGGVGVAAIGREIKDATEQAIAFESAMVELRRATGDMPAEGVKHLEGTILDVSRATGTSKEELAGMAAAATRAGRPVADLPRFLDLGAKAANVMGLKVGEAGDKLVQLGRGWGKDERGIEDTTDAVALAAERSGARAGGVLDFTNRFSNMRERGMSARQVAAFGAGFQGAGLDPSQAEGTFGDFSDKLANPQKAGPGFGADLARLGVGPSQARVGMRTDPTRQMVDVLDRLKALPDVQRVPMLERMFGPEGGRDIGRVVDHLDGLKRTLGLVENQAERSGALERSFKIFDDTTRAKLDKMSASAAKLAVDIGKLFAPAVGNSADAMARAFDAGSKYLELSGEAKAILDRQGEGKAPTPEQQADLDKHPKLRAFVGQDPDPAGTAAKREGDRLKALGTIQQLDRSARDSQDPQIRGMADDARKDYRSTYPERPKDEELRAAPDKHASAVEPGLFHAASFTDRDERPAARGGGTDALREVIAAGTKQGVVEGLREAMELRGGSGGGAGVLNASYEAEDVAASSEGGGGVHRGGSGAPNMRYGRAPRAAALPNMRYGRASGGGGYRDTPGTASARPHAGGHGHAGGGYRHTPGHDTFQPGPGTDGNTRYHAKGGKGLTEEGRQRVNSWMGFFMKPDAEGGMGLPRDKAAAMVGMMQGESGQNLNPKIFNPNDNGGPSGGSAQWHDKFGETNGRLTQLKRFAAKLGKPWTDVEVQQQFWKHEAKNGESKAWARIQAAPDGPSALRAGIYDYERPADKAGEYRKRLPNYNRVMSGDFDNGSATAKASPRPDASPAEPHSPRFTDPRMKTPARAAAGASRPAGAGAAPASLGPAPVQNFYGNHDPAQTARMAMMEQNREVRRSQARALHSVGRVA